MPFDSSMYRSQVFFDPFGSYAKGQEQGQQMKENEIRLSSLARQQKLQADEDQFNAGVKGAYVVGPDGKPALDQGKLSDLAKNFPQKTMEFQQQKQMEDLKRQKAEAETAKERMGIVGLIAGGVKSQAAHDLTLPLLKQMGADDKEIAFLGPTYDESKWKRLVERSKDAMDIHNKEVERGQRDRELGIREKEYGQKRAEHKDALGERLQQRQDLQDNQIHSRVVQNIKKDPVLTQKLGQYNNLQGAMSNFLNAEHPTAQSFDELQQAVRANLGIKGQSAVGEREHTTMNSLGLNTARMLQFVSGNPQDIEKDTGLAKHIQDLVRQEYKNIESQKDRRLNALMAGHESIYKRRPDLKEDLAGLGAASKEQFDNNLAPADHPQDNEAVRWAQQNPNDPRSSAILKANGVQ